MPSAIAAPVTPMATTPALGSGRSSAVIGVKAADPAITAMTMRAVRSRPRWRRNVVTHSN
ncbi:hypothetical protein H5P33_06320 [Mycolicibacterium arabiense]|uniref:hypothetical protein n=1 Tax=Mycolicibacterium arabiense TaxID=1286181 RepID=UPI0013D03AD2|nr:hypothetical protein [Mycolicibacterium arabiense]MCV7372327.1 hypothetical protein [Mycolicibacterium arabiense]